jgi:hypothetical protein
MSKVIDIETTKLLKKINKLKKEIRKLKRNNEIYIEELCDGMTTLTLGENYQSEYINDLPFMNEFTKVKKLTIDSENEYTNLDRFVNLKTLNIYGDCNYKIVIPNNLTKLKKLSIFPNYHNTPINIPDTLINLKILEVNLLSHELSPKFTKLKILNIIFLHTISYIPEEYINLKKVKCWKLFHKVNENIIYENNNKKELKKLYNTLIKMQRITRLKIAKSKMRLLYNPLYIGGYLGKKRLKKIINELTS